jgi:hypothetical protein
MATHEFDHCRRLDIHLSAMVDAIQIAPTQIKLASGRDIASIRNTKRVTIWLVTYLSKASNIRYIMSRWTREELMQAPDEVEQLITGLRFATSTSYEPSSSTYSNIDSKIIPDNHPTDLRTNASPFKSFGISVGTECTLVHCSLYTRCIYRVLTPRELRNQVVNLHCFATISLKPLNF